MPARAGEEKARLLAASSLFSGLGSRELEALARVAHAQALPRREELFHKGDEGSQIYVVAEGRLKALTTSLEGDDVVFNILQPGEVIGEIALLSGSKRTATVVAIDACELLVIDRRDFFAFLREHPPVAIELLRVLAERLKRVSELVEDTLFLNLPLRLAKKLAAFARTWGQDTDGGLRIDLKLSQEEWGDLVGATRESINKQLRAWTEEGVLSMDQGYVVIHKVGELEKLARQVIL